MSVDFVPQPAGQIQFNPNRPLFRVFLGLSAALLTTGALALVMANSLPILFAFAVLFGAGSGGLGILTVAILPDYFGTASLGKILGFSTALKILLPLNGPIWAGLMYDLYGALNLPLLILAGLSLLGTLFFLMASPPQPPGGPGRWLPCKQRRETVWLL